MHDGLDRSGYENEVHKEENPARFTELWAMMTTHSRKNSIPSMRSSRRSPSLVSFTSTCPPTRTSGSWADDNGGNLLLLNKLRERFKNKELEHLYKRYQQRLMHVNFKALLLMQICLSLIFIVILLAFNVDDETTMIPEAVGHLVLILTACALLAVAFQEQLIRNHPWIHWISAFVLAFLLVAVDLSLSFWFNGSFIHVPAALYTILVVYNLMPLRLVWQAAAVGFAVSAVHLASWSIFAHADIFAIVANVAFYLAANLSGVFTKVLNEITLRRAFLDRRNCIDTTIRFEYEKSQEEQLMLSILPKHIASEVREDIREEMQLRIGRKGKSTLTRKPFEKLYVERHQDVTVLYADIVNFTPLTATLPSGTLVAMLNELFGKFDEAAKETNCLRIKILGDCYYCVSGIPDSTTEHARNCVEMGFKMIEIIRQVREEHRIDVDMRIGVHSGSVISGLLGLCKWQFDIWSRDVTIANHMEQSGKPGRVHISFATKALLGDAYKYEPGYGSEKDSYLAKLGMETFLVVPPNNSFEEVEMNKRITFQLDTPTIATDLTDGPLSELERASDASTVRADDLNLTRSLVLPSDETVNSIDDDGESDCSSLYVSCPSNWSDSTPKFVEKGISFPSLPRIYPPQKKWRKSSSQTTRDDQSEEIHNRITKNSRKSSQFGGVEKMLAKRRSTAGDNRRGAVLMDSSLVSFRQMMDQADSKMEQAIESMHLSKFRSSPKPDQLRINLLFYFSDWSWELPFLLRRDPLFNLYILGTIPVLLGVGAIQLFLYIHEHCTFWLTFGIALVVVTLSGFFLWSPSILKCLNGCSSRSDDSNLEMGEDADQQSASDQRVYWWTKLCRIKEYLGIRLLIFVMVVSAICSCSLADLNIVFHGNETIYNLNSTNGFCDRHDPRINLWYFTHSCALTMTVAFGFYRVHFVVKLASYLIALSVYSTLIVQEYPVICQLFDNMELCMLCNFSPSLGPEAVHVLYLLSIVLVLHVTDRQIEYIHRLDYIWKRQLVKEREEANTTRMVNKMLLLNILPLHVAEVYLDTSRSSDELYHEDYKYVAVMFAAIPNYMDQYYAEHDDDDGGLQCLEILNQIISEFDALSFEGPFQRIEKIKLVSSTYMAACGLASKRKASTSTVYESISSISGVVHQQSSTTEHDTLTGSPLAIMVRFAAAMSVVLERLNKKQSHNFQLRTGIDYGPVIAGVVGAQKPLYDIWGDTVNMASRLEYTGELGKIQVTEKTARLIESEGIHCERRGVTFLKGKGNVMTYWVCPEISSYQDRRPSASSSSSGQDTSWLPPPLSRISTLSGGLADVPEDDVIAVDDVDHVPHQPFRVTFADECHCQEVDSSSVECTRL